MAACVCVCVSVSLWRDDWPRVERCAEIIFVDWPASYIHAECVFVPRGRVFFFSRYVGIVERSFV